MYITMLSEKDALGKLRNNDCCSLQSLVSPEGTETEFFLQNSVSLRVLHSLFT